MLFQYNVFFCLFVGFFYSRSLRMQSEFKQRSLMLMCMHVIIFHLAHSFFILIQFSNDILYNKYYITKKKKKKNV